MMILRISLLPLDSTFLTTYTHIYIYIDILKNLTKERRNINPAQSAASPRRSITSRSKFQTKKNTIRYGKRRKVK